MTCSRCQARPGVVTAYWDRSIQLCRPCCAAVAELLDRTDRWPSVPWDDNEVSR